MRSDNRIARPFWLGQLQRAWESVPVVWLSGVRRVGKTTLARELPGARFVNCDLPSTARLLEDPERFYASLETGTVVFDEIHQLLDPSRVLKIAADEWPHLKVLATGSSTLAATQKFRDSLTGRKRSIHLLPVLHRELPAFGGSSLEKRLLLGGLPEALLANSRDPAFYSEWLDSYFARDIQELFRVAKRREFLKLVELVLRQSGGLLEISSLAKHIGLARPTVASYLEVLDVTHVSRSIRPFHRGSRREILLQPKVYGFDTGFVSFANGWGEPHERELGLLFEHLVLDTLSVERGAESVFTWRDKDKREVDFVLPGPQGSCDTVECKWDPEAFSTKSLAAFRSLHPKGANYLLSPQGGAPYVREVAGLEVVFTNLEGWESGEAQRLARRSQPETPAPYPPLR
ncbi:MAG TPA: ATP-binding protein [Thermoanaerobaculia bacterium]|nr:ATP-binding protein [Thermoanaerobaculia bacterium]